MTFHWGKYQDVLLGEVPGCFILGGTTMFHWGRYQDVSLGRYQDVLSGEVPGPRMFHWARYQNRSSVLNCLNDKEFLCIALRVYNERKVI